jgi:FtsH-binding integral membrane protein
MSAEFKKMIGLCEPAQVAMMIYILMFAMHLSNNINKMKFNAKTLRFLFGVAMMSLTSVITLDVYCKTDHAMFAWVLALSSSLGFIMLLSGYRLDTKDEQ